MNLRLISSVLIVTLTAQYAVAAADNDEKILDLWQEHETFSFENYVQVFGKLYDNPEEYARRRAIFEGNVAKISNHNTNHEHSYVLGINQFADLLETELLMGLDKKMLYATKSADFTSSRRHLRSDAYATTLHPPFSMMMDQLPSAVDWRSNISVTTAVKNQGGCGSCWAFAATAALESHIALQTGKLFDLSVQELVSCAPNPQHCGGNGACTGSTAELAYEFVSKHGMVEEWNFAYQSFHGAKVNCTIAPQRQHNSNVDDDQSEMINGAVASVVGFSNLPTNSYSAMMNAIATMGPIVVNVAATGWGLYKEGIFDDDDQLERDINHAVVLEGYGTDEATGIDYWIIRNSWGPLWGENGRIRLKRVDPSTLDDPQKDCKMDKRPADGIACTKDESGKEIVPSFVNVCGTSGVLYDGVVPLGGHLV